MHHASRLHHVGFASELLPIYLHGAYLNMFCNVTEVFQRNWVAFNYMYLHAPDFCAFKFASPNSASVFSSCLLCNKFPAPNYFLSLLRRVGFVCVPIVRLQYNLIFTRQPIPVTVTAVRCVSAFIRAPYSNLASGTRL
jgi:hypothetical protein